MYAAGRLARAELDCSGLVATDVVKGWRASDSGGELNAPEPRAMPRWDLGRTPIERF